MKVKEIMCKNVASIQSDETVERAAQLMKQYDCGSIPVCCQGKIEGIVTDRDITLRCIAEGKDTKQQKVKDIMTSSPATGSPEMDIHDAARIMSEQQIRRLPIVENNSVIGIVALGDISVEPNLQDNAEDALKSISQPTNTQM